MIDYEYLIYKALYGCLVGALTGCWAFLFTGPLSEAGMVFGWLKARIYNDGKTPEWLYLPLIGCGKCSAFWWAVLVCLMGEFLPPVFVIAVFTAYLLERKMR